MYKICLIQSFIMWDNIIDGHKAPPPTVSDPSPRFLSWRMTDTEIQDHGTITRSDPSTDHCPLLGPNVTLTPIKKTHV